MKNRLFYLFLIFPFFFCGCVTSKVGLTYEPQISYKLKNSHRNQTLIISKCIDQRQDKDCDGFAITNDIADCICKSVSEGIQHYGIFGQVVDGRSSVVVPCNTNDLLEIRINKLASIDPNKSTEAIEGGALGLFLSVPGVIIASQIKVSQFQNVAITFRVIDGGTEEVTLNKTYTATKAVTFKGVHNFIPEASTNLNQCIDEVIDDFAVDLSETQLSGDLHTNLDSVSIKN